MSVIRGILTSGVSPDSIRDKRGTSAFGIAAYHGFDEVVRLLWQYGARLDDCNLDGANPVSMAAYGGSGSTFALMLVMIDSIAYVEDSEEFVAELRGDMVACKSQIIADVFTSWSIGRKGDKHALLAAAEEQLEEDAVGTTLFGYDDDTDPVESMVHDVQLLFTRVTDLTDRQVLIERQLDSMLKQFALVQQQLETVLAKTRGGWFRGKSKADTSRNSNRRSTARSVLWDGEPSTARRARQRHGSFVEDEADSADEPDLSEPSVGLKAARDRGLVSALTGQLNNTEGGPHDGGGPLSVSPACLPAPGGSKTNPNTNPSLRAVTFKGDATESGNLVV